VHDDGEKKGSQKMAALSRKDNVVAQEQWGISHKPPGPKGTPHYQRIAKRGFYEGRNLRVTPFLWGGGVVVGGGGFFNKKEKPPPPSGRPRNGDQKNSVSGKRTGQLDTDRYNRGPRKRGI